MSSRMEPKRETSRYLTSLVNNIISNMVYFSCASHEDIFHSSIYYLKKISQYIYCTIFVTISNGNNSNKKNIIKS